MALPTHTTCPHCRHEMKMSMWVYAHWAELLLATCESCQKKYHIKSGRVLGKE